MTEEAAQRSSVRLKEGGRSELCRPVTCEGWKFWRCGRRRLQCAGSHLPGGRCWRPRPTTNWFFVH